MCGRYAQTTGPGQWAERVGVKAVPKILTPRYNIAPGQRAFVVVGDDVRSMTWGLVPSWARDVRIGQKMINARGETLLEKPSFRDLVGTRRCLVPADGFYEWPRATSGLKNPVYFSLKSRAPFFMAGLWSRWAGSDGDILETFVIITTAANDLVGRVHDRMPVILRSSDETVWLKDFSLTPGVLQQKLVPYPSPQMTAHEVSSLVNSPANDTARCIEPIR